MLGSPKAKHGDPVYWEGSITDVEDLSEGNYGVKGISYIQVKTHIVNKKYQIQIMIIIFIIKNIPKFLLKARLKSHEPFKNKHSCVTVVQSIYTFGLLL